MKRVYIASAVGSLVGRRRRVEAAIEVGKQIAAAGMTPFIPHLQDAWFMDAGIDYEGAMRHCFAWVEASHAVYRIDNESAGADREVKHAASIGLPVFFDMEALCRWEKGVAE